MGSSPSVILAILFSLVFLVSWGTPYPTPTPTPTPPPISDHENFLECLSFYSNYSTPIVYTPQNPSYLSVLDFTIQNLRFAISSTPKPQLIVTPSHVSHVQATVICSRIYGMHVRTRSGGHDFYGLSYMADVPFIMIDLIQLRTINVDIEDSSAWVEAGSSLGEVYYNIAQKSRTHAFPAGVCPSVGVGGHISGGGSGPLMRKYGLAADNVLDAYIVDSNGRLLDRETMGEDLFWAIRGGGAASFGVVVAWKLRLVPVPPTVTVFTVTRSLDEDGMKTLAKWQQVTADLPKDLWLRALLVSVNGSGEGAPAAMTSVYQSLYLGNASELVQIVNESFPELELQLNDCIETSWVNSTLYYGGAFGQPLEALLNRTYLKFYFYGKADYVTEPIPEAAIEGLRKLFEEEDVGVPILFLYPYGGRMSEISETQIAFPHRKGNLYLINYYQDWDGDDAVEASRRHIRWLRKVYKYLTPYVSKSPRSGYLNYRDLDFGTNKNDRYTTYTQASVWAFRYFGNNFNRLVHIKTQTDPTNFFWNEQSIPSLLARWKN